MPNRLNKGQRRQRRRQQNASPSDIGNQNGLGTSQRLSSSLPTSIEQLLEKAQKFRDEFQFSTAIQMLQNSIQSKVFPQDTRVFDLLGQLYLDHADPLRAQKAFEQSIKLSPEIGYSKYMYLGQIVNGKQAVQCFNKGIQILQKLKQYKQNQQQQKQNQQQQQQQKTMNLQEKHPDFQLSISKINNLIADGCCSIAELYMSDLCFEPEAENECDRVLTIALNEDPNNINVYQTMASFRISQQRSNDAKECMNKVMEIYHLILDQEKKDTSPQSSSNAGTTTTSTADSTSETMSIECISSVIERQEKMPYMFRMNTAKLLIELGEFEKSEEVLEHLAEEFSKVVDVWYLLSICNQQQQDYVSAFKNLHKALSVATKEEDPTFMKEVKKEMESVTSIMKQQQPQILANLMDKIKKGVDIDDDDGDDANAADGDDSWEDVGSDEEMDIEAEN